LAVDEVNALLDSDQIKLVLHLGPEYTRFLGRIRVDALTPDGVARLAENLPYRDLNESLWQGIV
jgi:hypothetical protein